MRHPWILTSLVCCLVVLSSSTVQAAPYQLFSSGVGDIYRYSVTGPGTPTANGSISTGADIPGKMAVSPNDELFVSVNGTTDKISRFIDLDGTFVVNAANPTISGASINDPNGIRFRNDELFSVNFTNNEVVRYNFDGSGTEVANPPFVDTTPEITSVRARGVSFSPSGDRMYVVGCCSNSTNVIAVYAVDGAGLVSHLSNITKSDFSTGFSITVDGLQGLTVSDTGELWLADFGTDAASEIVRATIDGSGSLTAASVAIPGSHADLLRPLDLAFAPDGELFIANLGSTSTSNDGFLSRFTFNGAGVITSSSQFGVADNYRGVGIFFVPPPVPEPSSFLLLGLGVLGFVRHTRRRRRRA